MRTIDKLPTANGEAGDNYVRDGITMLEVELEAHAPGDAWRPMRVSHGVMERTITGIGRRENIATKTGFVAMMQREMPDIHTD